MSKSLNEAIGGRVRAYRESLGMSREAFSEQIGLSPQFLAEAEKGKKGLSAESIYKICSTRTSQAELRFMFRHRLTQEQLSIPQVPKNSSATVTFCLIPSVFPNPYVFRAVMFLMKK